MSILKRYFFIFAYFGFSLWSASSAEPVRQASKQASKYDFEIIIDRNSLTSNEQEEIPDPSESEIYDDSNPLQEAIYEDEIKVEQVYDSESAFIIHEDSDLIMDLVYDPGTADLTLNVSHCSREDYKRMAQKAVTASITAGTFTFFATLLTTGRPSVALLLSAGAMTVQLKNELMECSHGGKESEINEFFQQEVIVIIDRMEWEDRMRDRIERSPFGRGSVTCMVPPCKW